MKCTELVIHDHLLLRRGLNILDAMLRKMEDGERIEIADVTAILKFFRVFGDEYQQTMELVAGIEDALRSKRGTDFVQGSRRFLVLLGDYLDKEEQSFSKKPENVVEAEFTTNRRQPEIDVTFSRLACKYKSQAHLNPLSPAGGFARARSASI